MAMKDVSDLQVCRAVQAYQDAMKLHAEPTRRIYGMGPIVDWPPFPYQALAVETGQPEKVCFRAMERASDRGYIEVGTSLRTGWLSAKGKALLEADADDA